ncbi:uncharacterized protein LOC135948897 [Calliphora vicina]|uniref:uncharacterized protein LOC135948897 n=1 Tax=Calliphora vicina TaxID=7373 RepID=UPI00325A8454
MEVLRKKRSQMKRSMTRIYNFVNSHNATHDEIKVRIVELDNVYSKYKDLQDELDILCETEAETNIENEYRDQIEDMFFAIKAIWSSQSQANLDNTVVEGASASTPNIMHDLSTSIQAIVQQKSTTTSILECVSATLSSVTNMQSNNGHSELRIPPIQIPDFDGDLCNWLRFRDLFKAMVHSKTNLSNVEKLEYLQTKLKGEASSIIKHLQPSNDNYAIAWNLILENYDRPDLIEKQYFDLLFRQKSLKNATYTEFRKFYNNTVEVYNALKVVNASINSWDSILLYHIEDKLDSETIILWRREKKDNEPQTFSQLLRFLKIRLLELEETQPSPSTRQRPIKAISATTQSCPLCGDNHLLYNCSQFKALNVNERIKVIRTSGSCRTCNLRHNTLLHIDTPQPQGRQNMNNASVSINSNQRIQQQTTFLPTALIMVRDKDNVWQSCRALIDSGAQSTLVSEACVQRLHLNRTNDKTLIYGVGDSNTNYTRGRVQLEIFAPGTKGTIIVQTYCLSNLTHYLPSHTVDNNDLQFFNNLHLGDPEYFKKNKIDIIIGADVFAHCILEGKVTYPSGSPIALNTIFGWIIMGNVNEVQQSTFVAHIYSDLDMQLQKFWDTEDCQHPTKHLSQEEEMAERHYTENVERQEDGKYMVRLPFKSSPVELGESKCSALKRLESMERRFARNPELKEEFHKFMEEYERLEHMQLAPNGEKQAYYMPHHAVLKPSSTTTKLRVVFDASCKTSNNLSLNDQLLVGPTVQNDLYTILLKFRKFEIGFTADIENMYRQVTIHPADRQFQTILWRNSPDEATRKYQLTTVTYGTSAAPFLATRTLQQVAIDNSTEYPTESHEIINNFYVDDYMSSSPDLESANSLRITLCSILSKSGFNLRKRSSNSQQFRENIEPVDRAFSSDTIIDCSETVKTLGLLWNTTTDCFQYSVSLMESSDKITKRHVLSEISKIYDPIGWLAPMVIRHKIFMQKLWLKGINWDQELPNELKNEWLRLKQNIHQIKELQIPRWLQLSPGDQVELHGFSDSSELAYAAAIYIHVTKQDGSTATSLLTAKTRVANHTTPFGAMWSSAYG